MQGAEPSDGGEGPLTLGGKLRTRIVRPLLGSSAPKLVRWATRISIQAVILPSEGPTYPP